MEICNEWKLDHWATNDYMYVEGYIFKINPKTLSRGKVQKRSGTLLQKSGVIWGWWCGFVGKDVGRGRGWQTAGEPP